MTDARRAQDRGGRDRGQGRARALGALAVTVGLIVAGLAPLPAGRARGARQSARSPELSRAEREAGSGGYYEGLIAGNGGPDGSRSELALRLQGKPPEWVRFQDAGVATRRKTEFILFTLRPNQDRELFGRPFTTNAFGLRDVRYTRAKPPGTFRIALLGSSIDMGWGVGTDETYENRLETWLNTHAARRGLPRRFEILNFAVAAYGPAQRLEAFRRRALGFDPDLVLYSATMLDPRLLEIHLCGLLQGKVDPTYDFLRRAIADARLEPGDLRRDAKGELVRKEAVKAKLKLVLWPAISAAFGTIAEDCRLAGLPMACLILPRVGRADAPGTRDRGVALYRGIAERHGVPVLDLSGSFDAADPAALEIAAWDDHPNALGHKILFLALARALVRDPSLYRTIFDADLPADDDPGAIPRAASLPPRRDDGPNR